MKYPGTSGVLRRVEQDNLLTIEGCDGSNTFAHTRDVCLYLKTPKVHFPRSTDSTVEAGFALYEPIMDATLPQMFGSLSRDPSELCFTEHQIIAFCTMHTRLLGRRYPTFLLFRVGRLFFVAWAFDYGSIPVITVHDFFLPHPLPLDPYRLVVPEALM